MKRFTSTPHFCHKSRNTASGETSISQFLLLDITDTPGILDSRFDFSRVHIMIPLSWEWLKQYLDFREVTTLALCRANATLHLHTPSQHRKKSPTDRYYIIRRSSCFTVARAFSPIRAIVPVLKNRNKVVTGTSASQDCGGFFDLGMGNDSDDTLRCLCGN